MEILSEEVKISGKDFLDVGCSNGYITDLITHKFQPKVSYGFDIVESNLEIARKKYPEIEFNKFDLNKAHIIENQHDVVTCFETLEHIGNLTQAVENLLNLKKEQGFLLISVPIEIGWVGLARVFWRTLRYGYNSGVCFYDFSGQNNLFFKYVFYLLTGERTSKLRDKRKHWSTHFGFDYRDIDEYLNLKQIDFKTVNKDMNRFYIIS